MKKTAQHKNTKGWTFIERETKPADKGKRGDLVDITIAIITRELLKKREEFLENDPKDPF
ncbi:MAG: hypothetical protein WBC74_02155 [Candidatus Omnitrophota bacterium]